MLYVRLPIWLPREAPATCNLAPYCLRRAQQLVKALLKLEKKVQLPVSATFTDSSGNPPEESDLPCTSEMNFSKSHCTGYPAGQFCAGVERGVHLANAGDDPLKHSPKVGQGPI